MQSVGEAMAIGRTFPESLQKAMRSLEHGRLGLACDPAEAVLDDLDDEELLTRAAIGTPDRPFQLEAALRRGISVDVLAERTKVDPWFLDQILAIVEERAALARASASPAWTGASWRRAKRLGFSDAQLGWLWRRTEAEVRAARLDAGVRATFKTVDTCAAEFEAATPYHYSTYEDEDEVRPSDKEKVLILGSGPNRIGQGIEFDYCCVHASFALADAGFETVMLNCNPETVSTDYDTSDRLYFEPLTLEDALNVIEAEQAAGTLKGVIVSLGGQTPLKLSGALPEGLVLGTSPESIDLAEDRERWNALCARLEIPQPAGGTATTLEQAQEIVEKIGYPVLMRPSYVLGGRAMEIVYDDESLKRAMDQLAGFGSLGKEGGLSAERPVLIDRFLEDATEVDVDAIRDVTGEVIIGGVMEHVEEAGVHSGDSACALPPYSLSPETIAVIEGHTRAIATELEVVGLINVQYAVKANQVFVIEANPRASRTVPFVAKATGVPLVKVAARTMVGATLAELREEGLLCPPSPGGYVAIKEAVLPVQPLPRRRLRARPGDAQHRRGDGHRHHLRAGLRQEPAGGGGPAPRDRVRVHVAGRPRQGHRHRGGPSLPPGRLHDRGHRRHRRRPRGERHPGRHARRQGRRAHRHRRGRADQLAAGAGRGQQPARPRRPRRRRPHPRRGGGAGHPVPHHRGGRAGGRQRHPRPGRPRAHRAHAAGVPRRRRPRPPAAAARMKPRRGDRRRPDDHRRVGDVAQPDPHRVGHRRATAPSWRPTSTSARSVRSS